MNKSVKAMLALLSIILSSAVVVGGGLESGFSSPPAESQAYTWWHWMDGNVTREGITADLEAMAENGIGGALIFNLAGPVHSCDTPLGPVKYFSPEWFDRMKFAASEAGRLGLELGMQNCAGWQTSGGPWVTPDIAMQRLTSAEIEIWGSQSVEIKLPHPEFREGFYRDIAVFAIPVERDTGFRVFKWQAKAGQRATRGGRQPELKVNGKYPAIPLKSILNISHHLSPDGFLSWKVPPGKWRVIRLGHTPTGKRNSPAPKLGTGLEIDKLRRDSLNVHWEKGIQPVINHLGPLVGAVMKQILVDSYEAGLHHWTPNMREEFEKRRGYDPTPYLLALTGRPIEDAATTERFYWDFRRTISDLFADNYYGYFADLCHERGLEFLCEPYTSCFEGLAVAAKTDIPTGEFWANGKYSFSLRTAASVAHINGRRIAAAEAFTAGPDIGRWLNHPGSLRRVGDLAWTKGINRFVLHSYAHQPWLDQFPGMTMGQYGAHFGRNNTWWKPGQAWMQYIARSQFLLQSGEFGADVLCFAGNAAPNGSVYRKDISAAGFGYDSCGTDVLAALKVDHGDVVLPTGKRYRLLVLPNHTFHTPAFARKLRDLVRAGATILGPKPRHTPSLQNFPASENEVRAMGEQVWGKCDGEKVKSNRFGHGRVFHGVSPADVLAELDVAPAVQLPEGMSWLHRHTEDADIFFVSNQTDAVINTMVGFRVVGKVPEIWDAETGAIRPADGWKTAGKHVQVSLRLDAEKSVFVVFRKSGQSASPPVVREWDSNPLRLIGPWNLSFQGERGSPATAKFDQLVPWNEHPDAGIKYFSGTATNSINFHLSKEFLKNHQEVWLDLGQVAVMAEVRVNGENLGVLWHKPFRVDVSEVLKSGANTLEVDVTNLWVNRLIGDEQHPSDVEWAANNALVRWPDWLVQGKPRPSKKRITFTTWKHWNANDPLLPSGLIGPVTLRGARRVEKP
ncbi:MAG: hypothetical protein KJO21_01285 [Verrucomicrobiae bacterium]|nr:hypothetical protein [Verrucomicrobiae bacterium]NNJ42167.1 hypothetical protein [Akkermansiaceae bacterium]